MRRLLWCLLVLALALTAYARHALGDFVGAFVIALLIVSLDMASMPKGVLVGVLLWIGAAGAYGVGLHMASGRSLRGYLIDTGRQLASFAFMGAILGMWHD